MEKHILYIHGGLELRQQKVYRIQATTYFFCRRQKEKLYPKIFKESATQSNMQYYSPKFDLKNVLFAIKHF